MLVSWNWLKNYVALDMELSELEIRLAMAGLNHEGTRSVGDDFAIDLEVTSNRPDCLGHIGVAREISVLWNQPLNLPDPQPVASGPSIHDNFKIRIDAPELCSRYIGRIIRGVKIGPSPQWLQDQLATIFLPLNKDWKPVNNVVDISNYVLMETGQPLHTFDLKELFGGEVVVREATDKEAFQAIDHKLYHLEAGICVIADKESAIALGGVMGGAETEVSEKTTDLLLEAAQFAPLAVRRAARGLNLHSPSSHRFERGVDPEGIDWASRRCCELILEIAGGELDQEVIDVGQPGTSPEPVVLPLAELKRILGIEIPTQEVQRILLALGNEDLQTSDETVTVTPPSWRPDLTRSIDLVEEVARIHGYDQIPEDVGVPMVPSHRTNADRIQSQVRQVMTAAGFDEAITASMVPTDWTSVFTGWTSAAPLLSDTPMLKGADTLRTSLIPSLLEARRINQSLSNPVVELFETANIYLPSNEALPTEQWTLAVSSSKSFFDLKGLIETLVETLKIKESLEVTPCDSPLFTRGQGVQLELAGQTLGFMGDVSTASLKQFSLRSATSLLEVNLQILLDAACLVPQFVEPSAYPVITRDLNIILQDTVRWSQLSQVVNQAAGQFLESLQYQETYRDPDRDGEGTKRILFSLTLRSHERTLTGEEADQIRDDVVQAITTQLNGQLLA
ncbi:MAG: phenylalanine--tRNA ligase subunit beta [Pirellulaceae bacterium]